MPPPLPNPPSLNLLSLKGLHHFYFLAPNLPAASLFFTEITLPFGEGYLIAEKKSRRNLMMQPEDCGRWLFFSAMR
jgi:hypothetical protein